jgi:hypothetical protein
MKVGLGVGLGLGIPILLLLGVFVGMRLVNARRPYGDPDNPTPAEPKPPTPPTYYPQASAPHELSSGPYQS